MAKAEPGLAAPQASVGNGKETASDSLHWRMSCSFKTVSEAEAEGKVREVYDGDQENFGYVPNHAKAFSLRPDVLEAHARTCSRNGSPRGLGRG
jgi:hypothetical protein